MEECLESLGVFRVGEVLSWDGYPLVMVDCTAGDWHLSSFVFKIFVFI